MFRPCNSASSRTRSSLTNGGWRVGVPLKRFQNAVCATLALTDRVSLEEASVDSEPPPHSSQLFTVRLWAEEPHEGRTEWRGQVKHVLSGKARYFRDWSALIAFLEEIAGSDSNLTSPDVSPNRGANI